MVARAPLTDVGECGHNKVWKQVVEQNILRKEQSAADD